LEIIDRGESAIESIDGEVHSHNFTPRPDEEELIDYDAEFDRPDALPYERPSSEVGSHTGSDCEIPRRVWDGVCRLGDVWQGF
jgi:hypothetical protein